MPAVIYVKRSRAIISTSVANAALRITVLNCMPTKPSHLFNDPTRGSHRKSFLFQSRKAPAIEIRTLQRIRFEGTVDKSRCYEHKRSTKQ